jgi:hypothetical protein
MHLKTRLATVLSGSIGLSMALAGPAFADPVEAPQDPALAAAVVHWFAQGGEPRISALQTDFEKIARAASAADLATVKSGCGTLVADVDKAQHYAALPDAQAQHHWSSALKLYAQGAADCVNGAQRAESDLMVKANNEVMRGSAELTKATERIQDILN